VAGAILGAAVLVGLAPGANRLIFVFVAIAAFVHLAVSERSLPAAAAGAMAPGVVGLGSGLVTGFGWLEGSLLAGGALAIASLFIKPARLPVRSVSPFAAIAVAAGVAALIPLVRGGGAAVSGTGSPIGILLTTGRVAGQEFLGEGLLDYAFLIVWPLAGLVGLPLAVLFAWWLVRSWRDPVARRPILFLAIPALGQVVALGLISHGEPRSFSFHSDSSLSEP
jgi:hypothetical protein